MSGTGLNVDKVLSVLIALTVVPIFSWFLVKGLRTGISGPQKLPATRTDHPVLYWTYIATGASCVVAPISLVVLSQSDLSNAMSPCAWVALLVFIFCLGFTFAGTACVIGYYTAKGFRSGTSVVFGRGGVCFAERFREPRMFWFDQILNIAVVTMLGTVGFGGVGLALWFAFGVPTLK